MADVGMLGARRSEEPGDSAGLGHVEVQQAASPDDTTEHDAINQQHGSKEQPASEEGDESDLESEQDEPNSQDLESADELPQPSVSVSEHAQEIVRSLVRRVTSCVLESDHGDGLNEQDAESPEDKAEAAAAAAGEPELVQPLTLPSDHIDTVQQCAPASPKIEGGAVDMVQNEKPEVTRLPTQEVAETEKAVEVKVHASFCSRVNRARTTRLLVVLAVLAVGLWVAVRQPDPILCGVNITTVATPERRRGEFQTSINSLLSRSGSNLQLDYEPFDSELTLALHIPQQRLNATLVLDGLRRKSLLGRSTHVVFLMPRSPQATDAAQTARDMTSDALFTELEQAVHGCSSWYLPTSGEMTAHATSTFERLNKPALESILKASEVHCPPQPTMTIMAQLKAQYAHLARVTVNASSLAQDFASNLYHRINAVSRKTVSM